MVASLKAENPSSDTNSNSSLRNGASSKESIDSNNSSNSSNSNNNSNSNSNSQSVFLATNAAAASPTPNSGGVSSLPVTLQTFVRSVQAYQHDLRKSLKCFNSTAELTQAPMPENVESSGRKDVNVGAGDSKNNAGSNSSTKSNSNIPSDNNNSGGGGNNKGNKSKSKNK